MWKDKTRLGTEMISKRMKIENKNRTQPNEEDRSSASKHFQYSP
jgi:hypothetical protein